jgi:phosphoenolpyruvate synthase/pyruvate phosphate dikinase
MSLYSFTEAIDIKSEIGDIGKKAQSLLDMSKLNVTVPKGIIVPKNIFDDFLYFNGLTHYLDNLTFSKSSLFLKNIDEFQKRILLGSFKDNFIHELKIKLESLDGSHFAVRSSSNCEDLENASFAGLYETKLNINGIENICHAIKECWSSLYSETVIKYCLDFGIELEILSMSVIVQNMVQAEKSGVIFSVNPLTGEEKHMLIEACFGLGEILVNGSITPDQYIINWYDQEIISKTINTQVVSLVPLEESPFTKKIDISPDLGNQRVLNDDELFSLAESAIQIQKYYGYPVDIEWSFLNGELFILQSRPVTQLYHSNIQGEWTTADFKDGGVSSSVCTTFMWSLYEWVWERELPTYLRKIKLLDTDTTNIQWGRMFFSRPYWNISAVKKCLKKLPGFNERHFDEDLGIAIPYKGDGHVTKTTFSSVIASLKVLFAMNRSFNKAESKWSVILDYQHKRLKELKEKDLSNYTIDELSTFYISFLEKDFYYSESTYFNHIFDNSNLMTIFKELVRGIPGNISLIDLVSGLDDVSHLKLNHSIWDLSRKILSCEKSLKYWSNRQADEIATDFFSGEARYRIPELRNLVDQYYYKSTHELDVSVPNYDEAPKFLIESIQVSLTIEDHYAPNIIIEKQKIRFLETTNKFSSNIPFYKRKFLLGLLRRVRSFLFWREEFRDISTRYYYFVRKYTLYLAPYFKKWNVIVDEGDIFFLAKNDIINLLNGTLSYKDASYIIIKNKAYYLAFRNFSNPDELRENPCKEINNQYLMTTTETTLKGIPCSAGIEKGRVKVLKSISDIGKLEQGDILITKYTDPGWTPAFALISAVATETGGVLSHAAVISREYGIPAVLAIPNLTSVLKDGQLVIINGSTGMIECIDEGGNVDA